MGSPCYNLGMSDHIDDFEAFLHFYESEIMGRPLTPVELAQIKKCGGLAWRESGQHLKS